MITPEQFQEIGEILLPLLDDLTEWIARDMIERFMIRFGRGEKKLLTGTDEWQAWVLEQAGGNLDEIQKALAKSTGKSQQEIAKIFKDSGIQAAKADAEAAAVTFSGLSPGMMAIITDAYERTVGEISNITRTTAGTTNQAFIDICDAAYWKVRTGAQSYTAAMLEGVKALGQVQPIVRYPSGHKDTLEVAVLRSIRTGVAQSSGNMTIQQCKDMGWNHVLVSQHLGARVSDTDPIADHAGWQEQNAAYTKFCTDNDLKPYHERLAVAGWDRSAASTASAAVRKELDKYKKYHYNKDGTIVVTDDWTSKAKPHVPGQYRSYAVVDTASMGGKQRDRTFFDADGWQCRQISNGPHGNPKRHPYGAKGEHAHDITWDDDRRQTRATRELTDQERKENADIL